MFEITSICLGGGYMYCRTNPPHPRANSKGLYPLHRVLMENKIGRLLDKNEEVHHVDEDKSNNDPDNLEMKTKAEHARHHKTVEPLEIKCECGQVFFAKPGAYKKRLARNLTGKVYCSRKCAGQLAKDR